MSPSCSLPSAFQAFLALRAEADKFQPVPEDFVSVHGGASGLDVGVRFAIDIIDPAAADASDVAVVACVGVEAALRAAQFELLHDAEFGELLQVPVHRGQADSWEPPPHAAVKLVRRRMPVCPPELLENHRSLSRVPHVLTRSGYYQ